MDWTERQRKQIVKLSWLESEDVNKSGRHKGQKKKEEKFWLIHLLTGWGVTSLQNTVKQVVSTSSPETQTSLTEGVKKTLYSASHTEWLIGGLLKVQHNTEQHGKTMAVVTHARFFLLIEDFRSSVYTEMWFNTSRVYMWQSNSCVMSHIRLHAFTSRMSQEVIRLHPLHGVIFLFMSWRISLCNWFLFFCFGF